MRWKLHLPIAILLLTAGLSRAEVPPAAAETVAAHTATLRELQRWRAASSTRLDEVLARRLDDLEQDAEGSARDAVVKVRTALASGRTPVLADSRGGPVLLQQAIAIHMEDRHALDLEAEQRIRKIDQDMRAALAARAAKLDADGDAAGAAGCRAEAKSWDFARARSIVLAADPVRTAGPEQAGAERAPDGPAAAGPGAHRLAILPPAGSPAEGPKRLSVREPLRVRVSYRHAAAGRAVIRLRPYFKEAETGAFSSGKTIFGNSGGTAELEVGCRKPATMDFLLAQMVDPDTGEVLAEIRVPYLVIWE